MTGDEDGPWVYGESDGGGDSRVLHSDPDCWRLQRANGPVREATDDEVERLDECGGTDCKGRAIGPGAGEGHLQSLRDAAAEQDNEQEDAEP